MGLWNKVWKMCPGPPGALIYLGSSKNLCGALWENDLTPAKHPAHHEVFSQQLIFQMYLERRCLTFPAYIGAGYRLSPYRRS